LATDYFDQVDLFSLNVWNELVKIKAYEIKNKLPGSFKRSSIKANNLLFQKIIDG